MAKPTKQKAKGRYWFCVIGPVPKEDIPFGGDAPPRMAVRDVIHEMTDTSPTCLSGWVDEDEAVAMNNARHKCYKKKRS